jgi:hypothetical protein
MTLRSDFMYASEMLSAKNISDNLTDIEQFGYDVSYRELEFRRGQINYDRICDSLLSHDRTVDYRTLPIISLNKIKQLVFDIYDKLFDGAYNDKIFDFSKLVQLVKIDEPFDAMTEHDIIGDESILRSILISDTCSVVEVSALAHEYMHGLLLKYNTSLFNQVMSNYHYSELLSMIIEYLSSYYMESIYSGILDYNSFIRLHSNHINVQDQRDVQKLIQEHKMSLVDYSDAIDYQSHNQFTYIICDMYASYLASLNDKELLKRIKSVIEGESSIRESIIKPYELSLTNKHILEHYNKKMN